MQTVVILGSAYPFRSGGITTFNERLAREFQQQGYQTVIYTFSLQYPNFLFPGKTQYSEDEPPADLRILQRVNAVNPLNWLMVGQELKRLAPGLLVVRYWLPFMGPALGTILRQVKRNNHTRIIAITDNIIPHEKRIGDTLFTRYFLKACDGFVTMSDHVLKDLRKFEPRKPAIRALHPLYDNFGKAVGKGEARRVLGIDPADNVLLFFGFIRRYKGLDMLLEAMKIVHQHPRVPDIKLLIAGEFYAEENIYQQKIDEAGIRSKLILKTHFIPAEEVKFYFCAADAVVQPYRQATQSGVTPLAYYFEKPMIVTNVGALPDYVVHGRSGLVTEANPQAIAGAILAYFELGEEQFIPHLRTEKQKYSWSRLVKAIVEI